VEKLQSLISNLNDWHLVNINGSSISWNSGSRCSAIDHIIVNSRMKEFIFSASFVDFPPNNSLPELKTIRNYLKVIYRDRDIKKSSVNVAFYSENLLEHSSDFRKLEIEYPELAYGFNWLLKLRCGYILMV